MFLYNVRCASLFFEVSFRPYLFQAFNTIYVLNSSSCILCYQSRFYVGKVPIMIIADVDMVKEILIRLNDQFPDRIVSRFIPLKGLSNFLLLYFRKHYL